MEILPLLLSAGIGALIGALLVFLWLRGQSARLEERAAAQQQAREQAETALIPLRAELDVLRTDFARAQTALEGEKRSAQEKLELLRQTGDEMSLRFKQLSQDILEEKSKRFTEQNQLGIDAILKPLREKISSFELQVKASYELETRDRIALKEQIVQLQKLNQQVSTEANQLSVALRGQNKSQGNWGEMILSRILELSGLEAGREYETQFSTTNEAGSTRRPDAIVHLPQGRDIVIDAKVSLTAYLRAIEAVDEVTRTLALREHVASMRTHIKQLGDKDYHSLAGIASLDFVLMFVPSEAAYIEAIKAEPRLYEEALARNIGLVGPSTLLPTLRTVENLWKIERQSRNAEKIAEEAGKLYDKFVGFEQDLVKIGKGLESSQNAYVEARRKLADGPGNILRRVEQLKKMGAKASKQLPDSALNEALSDDSGEDSPTS